VIVKGSGARGRSSWLNMRRGWKARFRSTRPWWSTRCRCRKSGARIHIRFIRDRRTYGQTEQRPKCHQREIRLGLPRRLQARWAA